MDALTFVNAAVIAVCAGAAAADPIEECARIFKAEMRDGVIHGAAVVAGGLEGGVCYRLDVTLTQRGLPDPETAAVSDPCTVICTPVDFCRSAMLPLRTCSQPNGIFTVRNFGYPDTDI